MMQQRQRFILLAALVCALVVTGLFTVRAIHAVRHFGGGAAEEIRPWMPIRYIARSHHVPPPVLLEALGLTPDSRLSRAPLEVIAREQHRPVDELIATLEATIERFHAPPAPPPPAPPPTPAAQWNGATTA